MERKDISLLDLVWEIIDQEHADAKKKAEERHLAAIHGVEATAAVGSIAARALARDVPAAGSTGQTATVPPKSRSRKASPPRGLTPERQSPRKKAGPAKKLDPAPFQKASPRKPPRKRKIEQPQALSGILPAGRAILAQPNDDDTTPKRRRLGKKAPPPQHSAKEDSLKPRKGTRRHRGAKKNDNQGIANEDRLALRILALILAVSYSNSKPPRRTAHTAVIST
ncbi:hypothetical protein LTR17_019752 [Elasticomyces elasticus]|nr:hypothetical protein LTR17_019752 [Elasticomyces elasticus]